MEADKLKNLLDGLNDSQRQAVTSESKLILCLAGAGTGKTRTLTHRVAYLHQEKRVGTSNMLALTFTRLAGKEMKERVMQLVGDEQGKKLFCNTFHAFCVQVLRDWGFKIGIEKNFTIYDPEDRQTIMHQIISDFGEKTNLSKVMKKFESGVNMENDMVLFPEECRVIEEYGYRLRQNNAVDLDRLIQWVNVLWSEYPDVLAEYQRTYSHVFVDEFQDTNDEQMRLLDLLAPENLFVVGDDFQSIYGWRGARVDFIIDLPTRRPECEVIRLEDNYRSTSEIVAAANSLISKNTRQTQKTLIAHKNGEPVRVLHLLNSNLELDFLLSVVRGYSGNGIDLKDIAILARTNDMVNQIKNTFDTNGMPSMILAAKDDPFKKRDISQMINWMDVALNKKDGISLQKALMFPRVYINPLQMKKLEVLAMQKECSLFDAITSLNPTEYPGAVQFFNTLNTFKKVVLDSGSSKASACLKILVTALGIKDMYLSQGLKNRVQDAEQAYNMMVRWEASREALGEDCSLPSFLKWLRYRDFQEKLIQQDLDMVRIMTVHASKGLEFKAVIVAGMNQGVFPAKKSADIEEERRLFYVAVTRAKDYLFITRADQNLDWSGQPVRMQPSIFLGELGVAV